MQVKIVPITIDSFLYICSCKAIQYHKVDSFSLRRMGSQIYSSSREKIRLSAQRSCFTYKYPLCNKDSLMYQEIQLEDYEHLFLESKFLN